MIDLIERLAAKLEGLHFDQIVGIARGGLLVATHLSHALDVPLVSSYTLRYAEDRTPLGVICRPVVWQDKVLLVEDGVASGTLVEYARADLERTKADVTTAALWVAKGNTYRPDVWLEEVAFLPSALDLFGGA